MDLHQLRVLAGLPTGSHRLNEKHGHYEPVSHPQKDVPVHEPAGGKGGADSPPAKGVKPEEGKASSADTTPKEGGECPDLSTIDGGEAPKDGEEPAFPEMIMALAGKTEGLTGDELAAMVDKIYQAGVKDGLAQAESGEAKEPKDDKPKEPKADDKKEPKKDDKKPEAKKDEEDDEDAPNIDKPPKDAK